MLASQASKRSDHMTSGIGLAIGWRKVLLHRLAQIIGHDSLDTAMLYIQGTQSDLQQAVEQIAWE